jgi:hypothetical protein
MDFPNIGAGIGAAIGLSVAIWMTGRRKAELAPRIEPALRERGPLSIPELQAALDMNGFYARGKVTMALGALVQEGKIEVIDAPEGTARLDRINHIRYRWKV